MTGSALSASWSWLNAARPAIDWASKRAEEEEEHDVASDRPYTAVRQPPARAQRGELGAGVLADLLVLVGLRADLFTLLRLVDPRWTSQVVATMYSANWRYSDCQFSATSTAKADGRDS